MTSKKENLKKGWNEIKIEKLVEADWNYKKDDKDLQEKLINNIKRNGVIENLLIRPLDTGYYEVVNGNHRLKALKKIKWQEPIMVFNLGDISEKQAYRIAIETNETKFDVDNTELASLFQELDVSYEELSKSMPYTVEELENFEESLKFDIDEYNMDDLEEDDHEPEQIRGDEKSSEDMVIDYLSEIFIVPPFNVLNREAKYWKDRTDFWKTQGINSKIDMKLEHNINDLKDSISKGDIKTKPVNSSDPVLMDTLFNWFMNKNGKILDLCADTSIPGLVAGSLGLEYVGYSPINEIIKKNKKEVKTSSVNLKIEPKWIKENACNITNNSDFDFVMCRPPLWTLEHLHDKENNPITTYDRYKESMEEILNKGINSLKDGRFFALITKDVMTDLNNYPLSNFFMNTLLEKGLEKVAEIVLSEVMNDLSDSIPLNKNRMLNSPTKILVFKKGNISFDLICDF